jgi:hypothetical protein
MGSGSSTTYDDEFYELYQTDTVTDSGTSDTDDLYTGLDATTDSSLVSTSDDSSSGFSFDYSFEFPDYTELFEELLSDDDEEAEEEVEYDVSTDLSASFEDLETYFEDVLATSAETAAEGEEYFFYDETTEAYYQALADIDEESGTYFASTEDYVYYFDPNQGEAGGWVFGSVSDIPEDAEGAYTQSGSDYFQGISDRDDAYGDYLEAAELAVDYIDTEIAEEQSNADLLGIDYQVSDADRTDRISDYFATIWSDDSQSELEELFEEFGEPEGFAGYAVERGTETEEDTTDEGSREIVSVSQGIAITDEEEEDALGAGSLAETSSILG